jgi:hypothetical protein
MALAVLIFSEGFGVGCSFSADTYIFRHGAGSAKNGCSIVEERLLSAIKEDGVEAKKRPELCRHFNRENLKLSAVSHFHWADTHPTLHDFFFDIYNELSMHFGSEGIRETKTN